LYFNKRRLKHAATTTNPQNRVYRTASLGCHTMAPSPGPLRARGAGFTQSSQKRSVN